MAPFTIATNASVADGPTLVQTVPHWVRVFGKSIHEIVVVVDDQPLTGRIAQLHAGSANAAALSASVQELESRYNFLRSVPLSSLNAGDIQRKWFGSAQPVRCQAGTPILAFV